MHFLHTLQKFIYVSGNDTFVCLTFSLLFIRLLAKYDEYKVVFDGVSCHKHYSYFNLILFDTLTLKQSIT